MDKISTVTPNCNIAFIALEARVFFTVCHCDHPILGLEDQSKGYIITRYKEHESCFNDDTWDKLENIQFQITVNENNVVEWIHSLILKIYKDVNIPYLKGYIFVTNDGTSIPIGYRMEVDKSEFESERKQNIKCLILLMQAHVSMKPTTIQSFHDQSGSTRIPEP